ncbi:hypothetical protein ACFE04_028519 [Oxalis oulophora]
MCASPHDIAANTTFFFFLSASPHTSPQTPHFDMDPQRFILYRQRKHDAQVAATIMARATQQLADSEVASSNIANQLELLSAELNGLKMSALHSMQLARDASKINNITPQISRRCFIRHSCY